MPEDPKSKEKSLEMRVAELEDRLAKMHVTEEEMKTFQKVSSIIGQGAASPAAGCVVDCSGGCINECMIRACTIVRNCTIVRYCTIVRNCTIVRQCFECFECGGGFSGGGIGGGGFGSLGG
jgi:hypothetical protein